MTSADSSHPTTETAIGLGHSAPDPTTTRDVAGARIGRYTVLEVLGSGGMGIVYAAYDPVLDRKIALKLVKFPSARLSARLLREAKALAKLSHPNIVAVYDAGAIDDEVFIAMEYVEGQTLRAWAKERQSLPPWRPVVERLLQAGRGLAAAHAAGVIHRDFKPDNVLIDAEGRVRVLDFGIAVFDDDPSDDGEDDDPLRSTRMTRPGGLVGTPAYMSPERLSGRPGAASDDVYAFLIALYECLYGCKPYRATDVDTLRQEIDSHDVAPPMDTPATVPRWLWRIVDRGLDHDHSNRYLSMEAVLAQLEAGLSPPRRWILPLALAASAAIGGVVYASTAGGADAVAPCSDADTHVRAAFNDDQRTAIERAFGASRLAYAAGAGTRAGATLDGYGDRWATAHRTVCMATVRGEQSDDLLDLRMLCLERRRAALAATAEILRRADDAIIERTPELLAGLPPIDDCVTLTAGGLPAPAPSTAEERELVARRGADLAGAHAQRLAGQYDQALATARQLTADPAVTAQPQLHAEALALAGGLATDLADYDAAERDLREAFWTGLAGGADEVATEAVASLIGLSSGPRGDIEGALLWSRHGDALARRQGPRSRAAGAVFSATGALYLRRGDIDAAREQLDRARAVFEDTLPPDHPQLAAVINNLGVAATMRNEHDLSETLYREAYEMRVRAYGPDHPDTIGLLNNIALPLAYAGKWDQAGALYTESVDKLSRLYGSDHPELIEPLTNLGLIELERARPRAAMAPLERAIEIRVAASGADHPETGELRGALGRALLDAGDLEGAARELAAAIDVLERKAGPQHPLLVDPLYRYGLLQVRQGKAAAGRATLERAAALAEANADPDAAAEIRAAFAAPATK